MEHPTKENTSNTSNSIPHLTDDNFAEWFIDMKAVLRRQGLWKHIQTPLVASTPPDDIKEDGEKLKKWKIDAEKEYDEKKEKHESAADLMTTKITGVVKRKLIANDFDDGYRMLVHLRELFAPSSESTFMQLLQELITLRPQDGLADHVRMEEYLDKVKNLSERIDATNIGLTNDRRTVLVLSMGLADTKYNTLPQIWSVMSEITGTKAIQMVREEVNRQKAVDLEKGVRGAAPKVTNMYRGDKSKTAGKCKSCGKQGHNESNCWKDKVCDTCGEKGHIPKLCKKDKDSKDEKKKKTEGGSGRTFTGEGNFFLG